MHNKISKNNKEVYHFITEALKNLTIFVHNVPFIIYRHCHLPFGGTKAADKYKVRI